MKTVNKIICITGTAITAVSCEQTSGTELFTAVAILLMTSVMIWYFLHRRYNKEKEKVLQLEEMCESATKEKEALLQIINNSVVIDEPIRKLLESRVIILDELLVSLVFDKNNYSPEKASDLIESIALDKETYMNTLGLIFSIRHPKITEYFKKCNLNTWEIGYCSLYCMGYKGKEIGNIMCSSKYYKLNSSIRKKLGMGPKDTNIDIYLRNLMNTIEIKKTES